MFKDVIRGISDLQDSNRLILHREAVLLALLFFGFAGNVHAETDVDIRAATPLGSGSASNFIAHISDCRNLVSIQVGNASNLIQLSPVEANRNLSSPTACEVDFQLDSESVLSPLLQLELLDGLTQSHTEQFYAESVAPKISLDIISIRADGDRQFLDIVLEASDDLDVSYVAVQAVGLRASTLRSVGGVVDEARPNSFADSGGYIRVYPDKETQRSFTASIEITVPLSAQVIAGDALVLLDAFVADASGNQASISEISFTGEDVKEDVLGLIASPQKIIFSNALEQVQIIPSLDYQFRGLVAVPGAGRGISYASSDSTKARVTQDGRVIPLAETGVTDVTITVSFPDQPVVSIPVTVDYSKVLVGLQVEGISAGANFQLPALNTFTPLPVLQGVFDDGSSAPLTPLHKVQKVLPVGAESLLVIDDKQGLKANLAIPDTSPLPLTISLLQYPDISVSLNVTAIDAAPEIVFDISGVSEIGNTLILSAKATDDVGIDNVEFWLDGIVIGRRQAPPYELSLPLTEELEGRTLSFKAVATDTAGQVVETADKQIAVQAKVKPVVPPFEFELPVDNQRVIEKTPFRLTISHFLGEMPTQNYGSGISLVEFFADGRRIGESYFATMEQRPSQSDPGTNLLYEIWSIEANAPEISTAQTSLAISARVHSRNGGEKDAPAKLIKVIENTAPAVTILSPVIGSLATVGQTVTVSVQIADDTLAMGTEVQLLLNGDVYASSRYTDEDNQFSNAITQQTASQSFDLSIGEDMLGETLELRVRAIDYHQKATTTDVLRLPVKGDQPPTIALSHPVEGQHLVSGTTLEVRANAVDDLGVTRVNFFVNDKLVGSDQRAPYAVTYELPDGIINEQPLAIFAEAEDVAGHISRSITVNATLGKDEEPPVINLVSPVVNQTDAGDDISAVVENSDVVVKVAGYDNVGVVKVDLYGVRKIDGQGYILTGDEADVLSGDDFPVQQIPGVLNAYSSLRLVGVPDFSDLPGVPFDRYPVKAIAYDDIGNTSEATVVIGVSKDQAPEITKLGLNKREYLPQDDVNVEIIAKDDISVSAVTLDVLGSDGATLVSITHDATTNLISAPELIDRFDFALKDFNLQNISQSLTVRVSVTDNRGLVSSITETTLFVVADITGPKGAITSPSLSTILYVAKDYNFEYRVVDESAITSARLTANGQIIVDRTFIGDTLQTVITGSQSYTVADASSELLVTVETTDIFGNTSNSNWRYVIEVDQPPAISIRTPAAGSRLVEGEAFTVNALVTDDRRVDSVKFIVDHDGSLLLNESATTKELTALNAGEYVAKRMRVPHRPETGVTRIGVRAVDDGGNVTTQWLDIEILDDIESPVISLQTPKQAFGIRPGQQFDISGTSNDNYYLTDPVVIMLDESGQEHVVSWTTYGRSERLEEVRIANPGTLGSLVVGSRFYVDYEGTVTIPEEFIQYVGQTMQLFLRTGDYGINNAETLRIAVTIDPDTEAPKITINSPAHTLYEQLDAKLAFLVTDDVEIASYQAFLKFVDSDK